MTKTPNSVSAKDLQKYADSAPKEEGSKSPDEIAFERGTELIDIIVEAGGYESYRDCEALAFKAVHNLHAAALEIVEKHFDDMSNRNVARMVNIVTNLEVALETVRRTIG